MKTFILATTLTLWGIVSTAQYYELEIEATSPIFNRYSYLQENDLDYGNYLKTNFPFLIRVLQAKRDESSKRNVYYALGFGRSPFTLSSDSSKLPSGVGYNFYHIDAGVGYNLAFGRKVRFRISTELGSRTNFATSFGYEFTTPAKINLTTPASKFRYQNSSLYLSAGLSINFPYFSLVARYYTMPSLHKKKKLNATQLRSNNIQIGLSIPIQFPLAQRGKKRPVFWMVENGKVVKKKIPHSRTNKRTFIYTQ